MKEIIRPNGLAISEMMTGVLTTGAGDFLMEDVPPSKLVVGLLLGGAALFLDGLRRFDDK
jgi:hypothetical protein